MDKKQNKPKKKFEFLIFFVMIGLIVLWFFYYYFLTPTPYGHVFDQCNLGDELTCLDFYIEYGETGISDGTFSLRLKNTLGEPIVIEDVNSDIIISTDSQKPYTCNGGIEFNLGEGKIAPPVPFKWETDKIIDIYFNGCNSEDVGFEKGEKGKVSITVNYHLAKSEPSDIRQVEGRVLVTVT